VKLRAYALLGLGLMQMTGDLLGVPALKAIAAATTASPAPKVFSSVRGLETYSTRFSLRWLEPSGRAQSLVLTPEINARLRGPYNRRNVYGAVLAYGPVLLSDERTRPMFEAVARHALCGRAPLLLELGLDPAHVRDPVSIHMAPLGAPLPADLPTRWERPCR
jgi:hypothetical protein